MDEKETYCIVLKTKLFKDSELFEKLKVMHVHYGYFEEAIDIMVKIKKHYFENYYFSNKNLDEFMICTADYCGNNESFKMPEFKNKEC